ncbi:hypothetical protein PR202_ga18393 [Eleusine coracana subsp. coracana]|uniref:Pentatricopeptide repeat-containing protein n=1 Tax=Eleusine coracana subsp. coracana TaxID=191504 RepID=A0AAV5CTF1_ELECO|nr:hypothetical protein PR202_ga18390 [Eleusine coracana subsp. coracana]GJN01152.1 hypothetical protein PR202_ga18393 [Eleusine coracana subsp. coracana]
MNGFAVKKKKIRFCDPWRKRSSCTSARSAALQPLLLRVLAAGDLRYAAFLLESYPSSSPASAPLHNHLLHALGSHRHPHLLPFSPIHHLHILTPAPLLSHPPPPHSHPALLHPPLLIFRHFGFLFVHEIFFWRPRLAEQVWPLRAGGDPFLAFALVSFYAKNRLLAEARRMFEEIPRRDAAVYNALLSAYAKGGHVDAADKLSHEMPERNVVPWTAMVSG